MTEGNLILRYSLNIRGELFKTAHGCIAINTGIVIQFPQENSRTDSLLMSENLEFNVSENRNIVEKFNTGVTIWLANLIK